MKTLTTKFALIALVAATVISALTSCTAQAPTAVPEPAHSAAAVAAAPKPTATPVVKAPVAVDPAVVAQVASGLTIAQYQAATTEATAVVSASGTADATLAQLVSLSTKYGKPVVVVAEHTCPSGGIGWGITGALYGSGPGCGVGDSASEGAVLAEVDRRAGVEGWSSSDYILIVTSTL